MNDFTDTHQLPFASARGAGNAANPSILRALLQRGGARDAIIERATSAPATTTGWADDILQPVRAAFVAALTAESVTAPLLTGPQLSTEGGAVAFTSSTTLPTAKWTAEAGAIPVASFNVAGRTLAPHKLAGICVATAELARRSDYPAIAGAELTRDAGFGLDSVFFSTAAEGDAPAGTQRCPSARANARASARWTDRSAARRRVGSNRPWWIR